MVLYITTCLLLMCALVHADEVNTEQCFALRACLSPFEHSFLHYEKSFTHFPRFNELTLREDCLEAESIHKCVRDYNDVCKDQDASRFDIYATHACTNETVTEMLKLTELDCMRDYDRREDFYRNVFECIYGKMISRKSDNDTSTNELFCNRTLAQTSCMKEIDFDECGNEMAEFVYKRNSFILNTRRCGETETLEKNTDVVSTNKPGLTTASTPTQETNTNVVSTNKPGLTTAGTPTQEKIEDRVVTEQHSSQKDVKSSNTKLLSLFILIATS